MAASLTLAGCGAASSEHTTGGGKPHRDSVQGQTLKAHPHVLDPVAGAGGGGDQTSGTGNTGSVSVSNAGTDNSLASPVSIAEVKKQLAASGMSANQNTAVLTAGGLAVAPQSAPTQVQELIDAGNEIAHLPYVWGGGHGKFIDTGYDCSGSLSFILAAAGLLKTTLTSGEFAKWGKPGPGKWITIFANDGHTFAYIAGLRFDTVALSETGTRWSNRSADEGDLHSFLVRHPPGF